MLQSEMEENFSQPGTLLHNKYVLVMVKLIYHCISSLPKKQWVGGTRTSWGTW